MSAVCCGFSNNGYIWDERMNLVKAAILPPRPKHGVQQIGARWPKAAACLHWPADL